MFNPSIFKNEAAFDTIIVLKGKNLVRKPLCLTLLYLRIKLLFNAIIVLKGKNLIYKP